MSPRNTSMDVTITHVEYGEQTTDNISGVTSLIRDGDDVTVEWDAGHPSIYEQATVERVE